MQQGGTEEPERVFPAQPRGIGRNRIACFVRGDGDDGELRHDRACLVPSRETWPATPGA